MLAVRMAGLIPNDYGTASEAIDHGKPLTIMAARTTHRSMVLEGSRSAHWREGSHQWNSGGKECQ